MSVPESASPSVSLDLAEPGDAPPPEPVVWPAGAKFMEMRYVGAAEELEAWYTVWLPAGAPVPAGAVEMEPGYVPDRHAMFLCALVAAVCLGVALLAPVLHLAGWHVAPLLVAAAVFASFAVPAGHAHDPALPARFVRVRELPAGAGVTAWHRVGIWRAQREVALLELAAGAWMLAGTFAGAYGAMAGTVGAGLVLHAVLHLVPHAPVEAGAGALERMVALSRRALLAAVTMGVGVLLEMWWFSKLLADLPRWGYAVLPLLFLAVRAELRWKDVFPSYFRRLDQLQRSMRPVPRREWLGATGRAIAAVLAAVTVFGSPYLVGPGSEPVQLAVLAVALLVAVVFVVVAMLGAPGIPIVRRDDPRYVPELETAIPGGVRWILGIGGATLLLGGIAMILFGVNWGLLGLPFGALALLAAITGIKTYVRYREVMPSEGDEVLSLPPPTLRLQADAAESHPAAFVPDLPELAAPPGTS